METKKRRGMESIRLFLESPVNRMMLLFGIEGICFQYVQSMFYFGNNIFATNLGATDSQIGLIQMIPNLVALCVLLPSGILSDRMKSSKYMPVAVLVFMGIMYFFHGSVPMMGDNRLLFFFLFLGLTAGINATYNAQWQNFFGDVTPEHERNRVYTFRNRFVFIVGTITPLLCGFFLARAEGSEGKLRILQLFYYSVGAVMLLQAYVLSRIKGGRRSEEEMKAAGKFSVKDIGEAFSQVARSKKFLGFFFVIIVFYMSWHMDWSMWYLGQVNYIGMDEAQLSYLSGIGCVMQLLSIGFWSKLNTKKSVDFTIVFGVMGLMCMPLVMVFCTLAVPVGPRPWVFIALASICNIPQSCINLCIVQMLLNAVPEKNRSITISLYTMAVTLSNALMPYLGVQIYTALGADTSGFILNSLITFACRATAVILLIVRYRVIRRGEKAEKMKLEAA